MSAGHLRLINALKTKGVITDPLIEEVMKSVDRGKFVEKSSDVDAPQPIGYNVTISAPHMHAIALEKLLSVLRPGAIVLDVGSGTGYLTACIAKIVGPTGKAIGVDHVEELVNMAVENCNKDSSLAKLMQSRVLQFFKFDGRLGYPRNAPYDAIHVGAAVEDHPSELLEQLKPGGRFVGPVGSPGSNQFFVQIDKSLDGTLVRKDLIAVRYGVLTDLKKQLAAK